MKELAIIAGSSNLPLAEKISTLIGVPLTKTLMTTFGNGERRVEILENVRNKDVFVLQTAGGQLNDYLMELLLILDALKRSSTYRVTAVMPNFFYSRQDRKVMSRVPISAKLVADIIQTVGIDRVLTADLHSPQISGFFDVPVDDLHLARTLIDNIKKEHPQNNVCMVSPDLGGVKRAKHFASKLNCGVAMIYKQRTSPSEIGEMALIGTVKGKHCIIADDILDSGKTVARAANLLMSSGATSVECYITHAVLSGNADDTMTRSAIKNLYVTDTIDIPKTKFIANMKVLSAAPLFAEAILGIHTEKSLSYLFDN